MENIIIAEDMTITRMKVIAKRTNNALFSGAKAMMIEDLKKQMVKGIAHFCYMKKNGEIREAYGTCVKAIAEKYTNGMGVSREFYSTTAYFDIEMSAWRSFRWENLIRVY